MLVVLIPLFLCWGSFLNVVGYRLVHDTDFWRPRSFCPSCTTTIAWYDNIPLISWFLLKGSCRSCGEAISLLYPFTELGTAVALSLLYLTVPFTYFPAYALFFSALIVAARTDLETMLISRVVTLFLVPSGFLLSFFNLIPLSPFESLAGALFGYSTLWLTRFIFFLCTNKEGLGLGDVELMALIGSYTGIMGCWVTLLVGSMSGTFFGLAYLLATGARKIPFGPFLVLGAMSFVLLKPFFIRFFFVV